MQILTVKLTYYYAAVGGIKHSGCAMCICESVFHLLYLYLLHARRVFVYEAHQTQQQVYMSLMTFSRLWMQRRYSRSTVFAARKGIMETGSLQCFSPTPLSDNGPSSQARKGCRAELITTTVISSI